MAGLPVDERGYPVPWFVHWVNGKPDFRIMGEGKRTRAIRDRLCWVCGEKLGQYLAFLIGPMCAINRVSQEPPSHRDCAIFSAMACPFLSHPQAKRREAGLPEDIQQNGIAVLHNPGVALLWMTRTYSLFRTPIPENPNGYLVKVGDPLEVAWYCEGKAATRSQVLEAIGKGIPLLLDAVVIDGIKGALALRQQLIEVRSILPTENENAMDSPDVIELAIEELAVVEP